MRRDALLKHAKSNLVRYSEAFPDPNDLLAEYARLGLEGIVAKRRDAPHLSGTRSGWWGHIAWAQAPATETPTTTIKVTTVSLRRERNIQPTRRRQDRMGPTGHSAGHCTGMRR
jgi:hypothetical protein